MPKGQNSRPKAENREGVGGKGAPARGSGEHCKLPQQDPGWSPRNICILDAPRAHETRLVAANALSRLDSWGLSPPVSDPHPPTGGYAYASQIADKCRDHSQLLYRHHHSPPT